MPHVSIKAFPGATDAQKAQLAEAVAQSVMDILGSRPAAVSVSFQDVAKEDWKAVYDNEILGSGDGLLRKPGYEL